MSANIAIVNGADDQGFTLVHSSAQRKHFLLDTLRLSIDKDGSR
jgi:hypothetical protein